MNTQNKVLWWVCCTYQVGRVDALELLQVMQEDGTQFPAVSIRKTPKNNFEKKEIEWQFVLGLDALELLEQVCVECGQRFDVAEHGAQFIGLDLALQLGISLTKDTNVTPT